MSRSRSDSCEIIDVDVDTIRPVWQKLRVSISLDHNATSASDTNIYALPRIVREVADGVTNDNDISHETQKIVDIANEMCHVNIDGTVWSCCRSEFDFDSNVCALTFAPQDRVMQRCMFSVPDKTKMYMFTSSSTDIICKDGSDEMYTYARECTEFPTEDDHTELASSDVVVSVAMKEITTPIISQCVSYKVRLTKNDAFRVVHEGKPIEHTTYYERSHLSQDAPYRVMEFIISTDNDGVL